MEQNNHGVIIREAYKNFVPPVPAQRTFDRLLSGIPKKYLCGLKTVVLTDAGGLSHDRKRGKTWSRKRKVAIRESLGLYHQKWNNEPAWIEIFTDNLYEFWPSCLLRMPCFRELVFAKTLFHELGHHIHKTQAPQYNEREDVAEQWRKKLGSYYFRRRYWFWFMIPVFLLLWLILKPLQTVLKRKN